MTQQRPSLTPSPFRDRNELAVHKSGVGRAALPLFKLQLSPFQMPVVGPEKLCIGMCLPARRQPPHFLESSLAAVLLVQQTPAIFYALMLSCLLILLLWLSHSFNYFLVYLSPLYTLNLSLDASLSRNLPQLGNWISSSILSLVNHHSS